MGTVTALLNPVMERPKCQSVDRFQDKLQYLQRFIFESGNAEVQVGREAAACSGYDFAECSGCSSC